MQFGQGELDSADLAGKAEVSLAVCWDHELPDTSVTCALEVAEDVAKAGVL